LHFFYRGERRNVCRCCAEFAGVFRRIVLLCWIKLGPDIMQTDTGTLCASVIIAMVSNMVLNWIFSYGSCMLVGLATSFSTAAWMPLLHWRAVIRNISIVSWSVASFVAIVWVQLFRCVCLYLFLQRVWPVAQWRFVSSRCTLMVVVLRVFCVFGLRSRAGYVLLFFEHMVFVVPFLFEVCLPTACASSAYVPYLAYCYIIPPVFFFDAWLLFVRGLWSYSRITIISFKA